MTENARPGSEHDAPAPGQDAGGACHGRRRVRRRPLSAFDRCVRAPIGFLWLFVLALVSLPVMVYMTVLYYIAQAATLMYGARRTRGVSRTSEEERVA